MPLFRFPPPTPPWKRPKSPSKMPSSPEKHDEPESNNTNPVAQPSLREKDPTTSPATSTRFRNFPPARAYGYSYYSNSPHPFAYAPNDILFFDPRQDRSQYLQPQPRHRHRDRVFFRGRSRSRGRGEDEIDADARDGDGQDGESSELRGTGTSGRSQAERRRRFHRPSRRRRRSRRVSREKGELGSSCDEEDEDDHDEFKNQCMMRGLNMDTTTGHDRDGDGDECLGENHFPFVMRKESVSREDVRARREGRWELERSNRTALTSLAATSTSFTTRLDTTFYTLLETASTLRTALSSLEHLTSLTSTLTTDFTTDTSRLEAEHTSQIANLDTFAPQVRKLEALEERMCKARDKAEALDERYRAVQRKVEAWDRREDEWQERVSRRLKMLWAGMGVLAVVGAVWKFVMLVRPGEGTGTGVMAEVEGTVVMESYTSLDHSFGNDSTVSDGYVEVLDVLSEREEEAMSAFGLVADDKESCHVDEKPSQTAAETRDEQDERDPLRFFDKL